MNLKKFLCFSLMLLMIPFISSCNLIDKITGKDDELPVTIEQVLGKGYDITSNYAFSPDIKAAVLELSALKESDLVKRDLNLTSGTFESVEGSTITEYQSQLATKISASAEGGYVGLGAFSAEVSKSFSMDKAQSDEYAFATSSSRIIKDAYYIEESQADDLKDYLTVTFKEDALALSPEDLIKKYGTHVMLGGILGARLDYHMCALKRSSSTKLSVGAYAKAKAEATYKGASAGGSVSKEVDNQFNESFDTSNTTTKTIVYGGKPEYGQSVQTENDYNAWIESIEGREIWCDYYPDKVIPIYDFIGEYLGTDAIAKKDEVKKYFDEYFIGKKIPVSSLQNGVHYVSNVLIGRSYGGIVTVLNGDSDIDTESNKTTTYKLEVVHFRMSDNQIRSTFTYTVTEGGGDHSKLQIKQDVYTKLDNVSIVSPINDTHEVQIVGERHGDIIGYGDNPSYPDRCLKYLRVRIDSDGNDEDAIYAKCDMVIYYTYRSVNN